MITVLLTLINKSFICMRISYSVVPYKDIEIKHLVVLM